MRYFVVKLSIVAIYALIERPPYRAFHFGSVFNKSLLAFEGLSAKVRLLSEGFNRAFVELSESFCRTFRELFRSILVSQYKNTSISQKLPKGSTKAGPSKTL